MTENTQEMTAGTPSQLERARAMAAERHGANRRTRGPMAELMRDAGFSAERIRATGAHFADPRLFGDMVICTGQGPTERFIAEFDRVADEMGG